MANDPQIAKLFTHLRAALDVLEQILTAPPKEPLPLPIPPKPTPPTEPAVKGRIIDQKRLRSIVTYSPAQIARLEKAGRFPQRVKLGEGDRARVGWVEQEVVDWLAAQAAARTTMRN